MAHTKEDETMLSRRAFVEKVAVGAVVAGAVTALGERASTARETGVSLSGSGEPVGAASVPSGAASAAPVTGSEPLGTLASGPAPWGLVEPLRAGAELAHGWTLEELGPVQAGSSVATLRNAQGRTHRVHVCLNGGRPAGLVYTARHDLVVMNGGAGELPTDEGLAQAVAALAHAVAANESGHAVAGLQAHAERMEQYAAGATLR